MGEYECLDLYARLSRNRLRLAAAIAFFTLVILTLSGLLLYLLYVALDLSVDFWLLLVLTWLLCLFYVVLRYAVGGRWVLRGVATSPAREVDSRLDDALTAASLASGMGERIRLFEIPHDDINAFSISLQDGTFVLFATRGMVEKLPVDQRVAVIAHEIAHMQSGETMLHTIILRLAGRRVLKKLVRGLKPGIPTLMMAFVPFIATALLIFLLISAVTLSLDEESTGYFHFDLWLAVPILLILFLASLPYLARKVLGVVLDREREYHADLHAVYLTRDPEGVYAALRAAGDDVGSVIILPSCFDALLFCPVVDYTSYIPFRTQPTMAERMVNLKKAFPAIGV
ncbi:MAG: hypothetical protein C4536_09775 [Actinobacteria bacterium]|jgi:Zn-dependent protease with chaperone function|nr:MAG: hypothetical protein C4536_09775 [Actinomycetota bacterium]